jgi:hypothetical protein
MRSDILQDSLVGGGCAAAIVLRLQAIDRDHQVKIPDIGPLSRDRPYRARNELDFDAHLVNLWQCYGKLAVANERLTPDNRDVNRPIAPDEPEKPFDKLLPLVVGERSQRPELPKMAVLVGVAARASERTLPCYFD